MASVDGSKSILAASDEHLDHVCGPCKKTYGYEKGASQYCCDCSEYLCDQCEKYHKNFLSLKHHKIVGADTVSVSTGRQFTVYCGCKMNKEVEFYCEDHADVICSPCKSVTHHNCKTSPIGQKSIGYNTTNLESVISRTKSLKWKYENLIKECKGNEEDLKSSSESCKKEIRAFRKKLDDFLDRMEQNMLAELERSETKLLQTIQRQITTFTSALQILDVDCQILVNARNDGRKEVMFASDVQTAKGLQVFRNRLVDFANDAKTVTISFEKDEKLNDMQNIITALGSLKISELDEKRRKVLLGQQTGPCREVNIRQASEEKHPWITGCTVMPNDYVVICDRNNSNVKLLDSTLVVTDSCVMPGKPWDISVLDTNHVIVTVPGKKQLQQVQVFPQLKVSRVIQLDKKCWGVSVFGDKIYVSHHNAPGEGEVRVLDKHGNLERRLGVNKDGSFMFSGPYYITVSGAGNKIFVSDCNNNTITCTTVDGSILYQYEYKDLRNPCGMYCDDGDNILVCCGRSHTVQVITAEGKLYNTILSSKDGLQKPCFVTYQHSDYILVIGCDARDQLLVYQLAQRGHLTFSQK